MKPEKCHYILFGCLLSGSVQFSLSVMSDSLRPPWTAACQASLSITNSLLLLLLLLSHFSSVRLCVTPQTAAYQAAPSMGFSRQEYWSGVPLHQLPEFTQTHAHWVSDAIQPSHPLSSPFPPAFNISQHQGLWKWVSSSHQVAKVLEIQARHQSFQRIFRIDFL